MLPTAPCMHGPSPEHVSDDPYQDDPRIVPGFNEYSPSGDVTADVVYANYGRPEDFQQLKEMGIDVKGKIVIVRYGQNFRGVKVFLGPRIRRRRRASSIPIPGTMATSRATSIRRGRGVRTPAVQRGSIQFLPRYPGDPTTPGVAQPAQLARQRAHRAGEGHQPAQDSDHAALLRRCHAHPGASRRPGVAARVAGSSALHLSRWPRARRKST